MSSATPEIIIIRRVDPEDEMPKGGVWKIAHADFMTALMAFFLVMWLISQADEATKLSVANYFNPVNLAEAVAERKGLEDARSQPAEGKKDQAAGATTGGQSYQMRKPRFKEGVLFQDPYAILARIAAEAEPLAHHALGADLTTGENDKPGLPGGEAYRDPFDPLYWQISPVKPATSDGKIQPGTVPTPVQGELDALASVSPRNAADIRKSEQPAKPVAKDVAAEAKAEPIQAARPSAGTSDEDLAKLKSEISQAVNQSRTPSASPKVEVRRTGTGTLISLTDDHRYSMFAIGSAEPDGKAVKAMAAIGTILKARPGKVVIRGHTDGRPFKSESYDNWRLSQARAQMALYMLVRGGLPEERVARVEGHADRDPLNAKDLNANENRRIEILIQE